MPGDLAESHPKKFDAITVIYRFEGSDLPTGRLLRAVSLSEDRYCGVSATLKPAVELRTEIYLNGERIDEAGRS